MAPGAGNGAPAIRGVVTFRCWVMKNAATVAPTSAAKAQMGRVPPRGNQPPVLSGSFDITLTARASRSLCSHPHHGGVGDLEVVECVESPGVIPAEHHADGPPMADHERGKRSGPANVVDCGGHTIHLLAQGLPTREAERVAGTQPRRVAVRVLASDVDEPPALPPPPVGLSQAAVEAGLQPDPLAHD